MDFLCAVAEERAGAAIAALATVLEACRLLDHRDEFTVDAAFLRKLVAERFASLPIACFEQQLVRQRRRPADLAKIEDGEAIRDRRLRRDGWSAVVPDAPLVVVEDRVLVPLAGAPSQSQVDALLIQREHPTLREVAFGYPLADVAGILVHVKTGDVALVLLPSCRPEEPQPVAQQRPAD